mmetsp:Transcript_27175/g.66090  ORF Transcript_27175/g.66090 Transcript_27175/m.66090 type:complete len:465 (-) Transcript_27175:291-1685(-)|eukprot:CAMPEP_0114513224 /NCGR_PEP_ID=MMETSP0109-20121206/15438_1 /TAXON_ID=29199 /ORGANISM="Chlorarachnion reptans, Strain CCCM449" /LENGTH=464 /DNA_ID=CAMNT_0001693047 /DNA_START=167 /DNA_END=1561 /DNA_ORIENTATION=+
MSYKDSLDPTSMFPFSSTSGRDDFLGYGEDAHCQATSGLGADLNSMSQTQEILTPPPFTPLSLAAFAGVGRNATAVKASTRFTEGYSEGGYMGGGDPFTELYPMKNEPLNRDMKAKVRSGYMKTHGNKDMGAYKKKMTAPNSGGKKRGRKKKPAPANQEKKKMHQSSNSLGVRLLEGLSGGYKEDRSPYKQSEDANQHDDGKTTPSPSERLGWKAVSDAAMKRFTQARRLLDDLLISSGAVQLEEEYVSVIPPEVHLVAKCYTDFRNYALEKGCVVKRRKISDKEKVKLSSKPRKGPMFEILVKYNNAIHPKRKRKADSLGTAPPHNLSRYKLPKLSTTSSLPLAGVGAGKLVKKDEEEDEKFKASTRVSGRGSKSKAMSNIEEVYRKKLSEIEKACAALKDKLMKEVEQKVQSRREQMRKKAKTEFQTQRTALLRGSTTKKKRTYARKPKGSTGQKKNVRTRS